MSKNRLLTILALAMVLGLVACEPHSVATSVLPTPVSILPTATPLSSPTWISTATAAQIPTDTPTLLSPPPTTTPCPMPTPGGAVWRILFRGTPCLEMLNPGCQPFDGTPSYLYLINSDGTDLEKVEGVPEGSYLAQLSPDGTHLAYIGPDNNLYLVEADDTNPTRLLDDVVSFDFSPDGEYIYYSRQEVTNDTPGHVEMQANIGRIRIDGSANSVLVTLPTIAGAYIRMSPDGEWILAWGESQETVTRHLIYLVATGDGAIHHLLETSPLGAVRWSVDGTAVQFVEWHREAGSCVNVFNTVDRDDHSLRSTFTVTGSCLAWGDWSPDGQEFAFAARPDSDIVPGLWILNLGNRQWYNILPAYSVNSVRTWAVGFSR